MVHLLHQALHEKRLGCIELGPISVASGVMFAIASLVGGVF